MDSFHGRTESSLTLLVRRIRVALGIPKYWHDDPAEHPEAKTWMWHIHHTQLVERLMHGLQSRIDWIRSEKPIAEIDTRLRLLTLVRDQDAMTAIDRQFNDAFAELVVPMPIMPLRPTEEDYARLDAEWYAYNARFDAIYAERKAAEETLHKIEHPNCPWNGKTIFPDKPNAGFV